MSNVKGNRAGASHAFLTIAIPISKTHVDAVDKQLDQLGNPAGKNVRDALRGQGIHFLSLTVLPGHGQHKTFLLIESSCDGSSDAAIDRLAQHFGPFLIHVLETGGVKFDSSQLASFLRQHSQTVAQGLFGTPGINFTGSPEMTVDRINQEYDLARAVRSIMESGEITGTPLEKLKKVKEKITQGQVSKEHYSGDANFKDLLTPDSVKILEPPPVGQIRIVKIVAAGVWTFLWPLLLFAVLTFAVAMIVIWSNFSFWMGLLSGFSIFLFGVLLLAVFLIKLYQRFRRQERAETGDDQTPDPVVMTEIMERENQTEQNHLFGVSTMKPGRLRRFTLRLMFWIIGQMATHVYRPGFLGELGTIHFARWILLPGTDKLLFYSNFGGSWESYLEDFITKAHGGLTGVWSNTQGFPKTKNLVTEGATAGDAFKRWARCQQRPTRFWYSAYPHLTTERIRINAAIRHGLVVATTEDQAATWLSCIGSRPRPAETIETTDVQGIVFGGLRKLVCGECLLLRLPCDVANPSRSVDQSRSWLREVSEKLSFGDTLQGDSAMMLGLTQRGLERLGMESDQIQQFPISFQQGMSIKHRADFLGDTGDDKPEKWLWGHGDDYVDAVLLIYDRTRSGLDAAVALQKSRIEEIQGALVYQISMQETDLTGPTREPFGFVDGISQPIIRGTKKWNSDSDPIHVVAPGEIILGYPDDRGQFPRTPTVPAEIDRSDHLAGLRQVETFSSVPTFEAPTDNKLRDFGRNGSFLVIRQLEQDVGAFSSFIGETADKLLAKDDLGGMFGGDKSKMEQWLAAKMVGRWKDGTSLIRYPDRPGNGWVPENPSQDSDEYREKPEVQPDNSFMMGAEDPMGYKCPFGAHIRRSNPRDSIKPGSQEQVTITNRHRILRMGRPYQPTADTTNPGLLFMCLNADIERQFEFIQQTWAMAKQFHGLDGEVDSILGRGGRGGRLTIPTPDGPILVTELKDFVKVLGGAYFFLPGHRAIRFLSNPRESN